MSGIGNALLDTNVVIAYLKRDVAIRMQWQSLATLYLPSTALGELYYGAYKSSWPGHVLVPIGDLLRVVVLLLPNDGTADHYGQIKAELAQAGTPIPQNDIWIAAIAKQYQLPLATRDRHFKQITGLTILEWQRNRSGKMPKAMNNNACKRTTLNRNAWPPSSARTKGFVTLPDRAGASERGSIPRRSRTARGVQKIR